jgi:hypothetical protein
VSKKAGADKQYPRIAANRKTRSQRGRADSRRCNYYVANCLTKASVVALRAAGKSVCGLVAAGLSHLLAEDLTAGFRFRSAALRE